MLPSRPPRTYGAVPDAAADVFRFAFRQGPGRAVLDTPPAVLGNEATTSTAPPDGFRNDTGVALPMGTTDLLATSRPPAPVPADGSPPAEALLGHLLTAAFGLQRREPSNVFNDHRTTASVRSKYPVRAFVAHPRTGTRYHDPYRHALVDASPGQDSVERGDSGWGLKASAAQGTAMPGATARPAARPTLRLLLAARLTDLPAPYGMLRVALTQLETGFQLRALAFAAQALDVRAEVDLPGAGEVRVLRQSAGCDGPEWGAVLSVRLPDLPAPPESDPLRACGRPRHAAPPDLAVPPDLAALTGLAAGTASPTGHTASLLRHTDVPLTGRAADRSWADLLWLRHSGRAVGRVGGFATRPHPIAADAVRDMARWSSTPPPGVPVGVARAVRTSAVVQRVTGLHDGIHHVRDGALSPVPSVGRCTPADPFAALEEAFGYPTSVLTDSSVRHANSVWVYSANLRHLLAEEGADAWEQVQRCVGWAAHGICLAAAGHRLYARTVRSYDEIAVQRLLGLPEHETPLFMVVSGVSRFVEPFLDLRV